jgi:MFS family permease
MRAALRVLELQAVARRGLRPFKHVAHTRCMSMLSREANVASDDYNRWLVVPPAVLTHLSVGGLYAWSVLNEPLSRTIGVVSAAPADWPLASVIPDFSTAVFAAGATGAFTGKIADRDGPRKSIFTAGALWGGGLMLAGAAVELHSLPLLYAGYGVIGGAGIGFACEWEFAQNHA